MFQRIRFEALCLCFAECATLSPMMDTLSGKAPTEGNQLSAPWRKRFLHFAAWSAAALSLYAASAFVSLRFFMRSVKTVELSDFRGMDFEAARAHAMASGLDIIESRRAASPAVPAGSILEQSPAAGFPVKPGQPVEVVVSDGPPRTEVPDLTGTLLASATEAIRQNGLTIKTLYRVHSEQGEDGVVLAQEPPQGTAVSTGAAVSMVVSLGSRSRSYLAPHFVGASGAAARQAAERSGFSAQVNYRPVQSEGERGTVVAQYPLGGTRFRRGEAVILTVGQ